MPSVDMEAIYTHDRDEFVMGYTTHVKVTKNTSPDPTFWWIEKRKQKGSDLKNQFGGYPPLHTGSSSYIKKIWETRFLSRLAA